jgi:hypothetical protein
MGQKYTFLDLYEIKYMKNPNGADYEYRLKMSWKSYPGPTLGPPLVQNGLKMA